MIIFSTSSGNDTSSELEEKTFKGRIEEVLGMLEVGEYVEIVATYEDGA
ncbi:hypothetical protein [Pyrococcus kukulkanii]